MTPPFAGECLKRLPAWQPDQRRVAFRHALNPAKLQKRSLLANPQKEGILSGAKAPWFDPSIARLPQLP
jgi:hypothetical protein